ncbi:MAG TPA: sialidase family protein [Chitinophagaceae bacterium]|nr:sialidase family protein [Chitinophagaceae bacterium]
MNKSLLRNFLIVVELLLFQQESIAQKSLLQRHPIDPKQIHIVWDTTKLRKVAAGGYARMIELKNGKLITVYAAANGNTEIVTSNDKGDHWSAPVIVAAKADDIRMDAPDITLLNDASLMVCYNPRPPGRNTDTSKHFAIRIAKSYDDGLTWKDDQLSYQAGYQFKDGCWEPAALQLPTGEIQLFFSDEGIYTTSDEQNISLLRSHDNGKTWTTKPEIVSFRKGSRDGMPVPVYLPATKEIIFSIEDNGFVNFKPYIIRSTIKNNWSQTVTANSANRSYTLQDSIENKFYAGAPYLRTLSNGNTVLSYQSTQFRQGRHNVNNAEMVVVVGDAEGRNFTNATVPFKIPANTTALWNSIAVLKDDTVVALTSTNAYNGKYEVWMIKGILAH